MYTKNWLSPRFATVGRGIGNCEPRGFFEPNGFFAPPSAFDLFNVPEDTMGLLLNNPLTCCKSDVEETDTEYLVKCELAGFKKENITVTYESNHLLTVEAKREVTNEVADEKTKKIISRECSTSEVSRSFVFEGVDSTNITCEYVDGVLKIVLPKAVEAQKTEKIEIK